MSSSERTARSGAWLGLLVACAVLTQAAVNLVRPVTSYKLLALQADATTIGLCTAAYAVVPLFTAVWLGRYSDRAPQLRLVMLVGVLLLAGGGALLALSTSVVAVVGASAVLGLGHLWFTIGGQSAIARYAADRDLDRGFGWFTAGFSAGQMIGPVLGGWLVGRGAVGDSAQRLLDVNQALWIGAALSLVAVPLLVPRFRVPAAPPPPTPMPSSNPRGETRTVPRPPGALPSSRQEGNPTVLKVLRVPGVASNMLASLALLATLDILTAFMPLIGEAAGVSPAAVGLLLGVRGLASIASRILLPWLSARLSRRTLLLVCLWGAGTTLALPPLIVEHLWWAGLLLAVGGFLLGLGQPLTMTLITTAVPAGWRGSALAVRLMGNRAGQVLLPLTAGVVAAPLGPSAAVWLCCGVLLVSGTEKLRGTSHRGQSNVDHRTIAVALACSSRPGPAMSQTKEHHDQR